ncbi:anti-phage protein KwaB [Robiginitalea biformata]|uniref:anti-phage protein KwaB n=1 Tax=Robiginitalea biformata TaxID=252307 RepID=UPI003B5C46A9
MTKAELNVAISSILEEGDQLSTAVYAIMKDSNEVRFLNIQNNEIAHIQEMFIESIRSQITDNEELGVALVSNVDNRSNVLFEYDLELPQGLEFLNGDYNDQTLNFEFGQMDLADIDALIIKIGTEQHQIKIYKKLSPVEVFGRGGYMLWPSNDRLMRFENKVLRLSPGFHAIIVEETILFTQLRILERSHGFHDVLRREATASLELIEATGILDSMDGLEEMMEEISFARKLVKVRHSPVLAADIPNPTIVAFSQSHPSLRRKFKYTDGDEQIILETKISRKLFVKLLDDAFLTSELTALFYESEAKDPVAIEAD